MKTYPYSAEFSAAANSNPQKHSETYQHSIENNDAFWAERAELLDWIKKPTKIKNVNYDLNNFSIKWFEDGELNVAVNCLDRHAKDNPYKPAIIWETDHPSLHKIISYKELLSEVCLLGVDNLIEIVKAQKK